MTLTLEVSGCAEGHVIRSIGDTPGVLCVSIEDSQPSFAVSTSFDPRGRSNGLHFETLAEQDDHTLSRVDVTDVVDGVTEHELFVRVAAMANTAAGTILSSAVSTQRWNLAHETIEFIRECREALLAQAHMLGVRVEGGDDQ